MTRAAVLFSALLASAVSFAAELAPYRPQAKVEGDIRIWGSPEDTSLVNFWEAGFRKFQPNARVVASLHGPESAMAGIYADVADIAFVGRELRLPVESMAFQWVKLYKPTTIEVANASLAARRVAANLAVFVNPGNPVAGLSLAQLDGIFGAEHKALRTWGDVGLTGAWRDRPIRVLAPEVTSVPALFFRHAVMGDSLKWNPALEEFASPEKAIEAVANDPAAIAYAPMAYANGVQVRTVPIAAKDGGEFVAPTAASVADHRYPLARRVCVAIDRAVGKPVDPKVGEFLRYVLSAEGQAAIARDGAYVPLSAADAERQAKLLD